jgi:hypothetical protein
MRLSSPTIGEDSDMDVVDGVRVTGPLAPHAHGFAGELVRLGFRRYSAQKQLQLAAQVSRWLGNAGLSTADLNAAAVDGFLAARRGAGLGEFVTPKALAPLLGYLRGLGVAPQPVPARPRTPAIQLWGRQVSSVIVSWGVSRRRTVVAWPLAAKMTAGRPSRLCELAME